MESHPQNPEFRINPENFHPCTKRTKRTLCTSLSAMYNQEHGLTGLNGRDYIHGGRVRK